MNFEFIVVRVTSGMASKEDMDWFLLKKMYYGKLTLYNLKRGFNKSYSATTPTKATWEFFLQIGQ